MKIEIVNIGKPETIPTAKGSYKKLAVQYTEQGKDEVQGKNLVSFSNPTVFNTLIKASEGDKFTVSLVKDAKSGHWNWSKVEAGWDATEERQPMASGGGFKPTRSDLGKRSDEVQVMIVRQSCLSSAVDFCKTWDKDPEKALEIAALFERWVLRKVEVAKDE